jgi:hypothetical protein
MSPRSRPEGEYGPKRASAKEIPVSTHAMDPTPWYRQRWPWLLIAGPAIVVVAGAVTIWLAVASDDGLVADDYYKQGLAINQVIGRTERAVALALRAKVDLAADGRVRAELAGGDTADANPDTITLLLAHPTRAGGDARAELRRVAGRVYEGRIDAPAPGRWRVILESATWRLPAAEIDGLPATLELAAGAQ